MTDLHTLFDLRGQTVVVTGGTGVLGSAMARALAQAGARTVIVSRRADVAAEVVAAIRAAGGAALAVAGDVHNRADLEAANAQVAQTFGAVDILVNAAGGNAPQATTSATLSFFDMDVAALDQVYGLNFAGTVQSCQVFGRSMVEQGHGCIVNITSMAALRPLTNVLAYSAAKAAVANFTQWLAVHMAQNYTPHIRVNALAPGFFLTEQNRYLLHTADGNLTPRGQSIIAHTPAGRLGTPDDLIGTLLWLVSPASAFVTGIVVPVDGGFSAFGGV